MSTASRERANTAIVGAGLRSVLYVALAYGLAGMLWILLSDRTLLWFVADPRLLSTFQSIKGVLFVAVSTVLLYVVVRGELRRRTEAEALYYSLAEEAMVGVYLIQNNRLEFVNPRFAEIFGYTREELTGRPPDILVAPEDQERVAENVRKRLTGGLPRLQYQFRGVRKDGQVIEVEVLGSRTKHHRRPAILGMLVDVTERRTTERELAAARERMLQAEIEKKRFYCEVIRAVTRGKFHLVDLHDLPAAEPPEMDVPLDEPGNYSSARRQLQEISEREGMETEAAADLVLAAGEAITNAIKHAEGGRCAAWVRDGMVNVRITDRGGGIRSDDLPATILQPGFSTKISLGMGYTMMLELVDSVWLATSPEGTIVHLQKRLQPVEANPLEMLLERF
jgi:PAS domain S-box-containing protein